MAADLFKRHMVLAALSALLFLRFVDLAVFDLDHDHIYKPHLQIHASEMTHSHDHGEHTTEADTSEGKLAHMGFHTLLGAFIGTDDASALPARIYTNCFGVNAKECVRTQAHRPPTPPPLA